MAPLLTLNQVSAILIKWMYLQWITSVMLKSTYKENNKKEIKIMTYVATYLLVGLGVYWYRNDVNPTAMLKESAIWPYYIYKYIVAIFTKKS